jgi:hypothetical protein
MKINTTIKFKSCLFGKKQTDSKVIEARSEKHAYQIAYRVYLKCRKMWPSLIFCGITTEIIEN